MPKLAHISDIHFGPTFDTGTWKNVRAQIQNFKPDILVVSGDFVDHPSPFLLLAVKSELEDLCLRCASRPQLFVAPGNHDVALWGNIRVRLWPQWLDRILVPNWFERIMFNDTAIAKAKINKHLGIDLGLNEETRLLTWVRQLKRLNPDNWFRRKVRDECDGRLQSCDRRRNSDGWPTESEHCQIAVACFDLNPSKGYKFAFATGEVAADQITKLGRHRSLEKTPGGCRKCAERADAPSTSAEEAPAGRKKSPKKQPSRETPSYSDLQYYIITLSR